MVMTPPYWEDQGWFLASLQEPLTTYPGSPEKPLVLNMGRHGLWNEKHGL